MLGFFLPLESDWGKISIPLSGEIWTGIFLMKDKNVLKQKDIFILHYNGEAEKPEAYYIAFRTIKGE